MQTQEIIRQFRPELQNFAAHGMFEGHYIGMQRLPAKDGERSAGCGWKQFFLGAKSAAVDVVAEERMAHGGEVDTDLVGASGLQAAGEQARSRRPSGNAGI